MEFKKKSVAKNIKKRLRHIKKILIENTIVQKTRIKKEKE